MLSSPVDSPEFAQYVGIFYPVMIPVDLNTGSVPEDYGYDKTHLNSLPVGWVKAFGLDLAEELQMQREKLPIEKQENVFVMKMGLNRGKLDIKMSYTDDNINEIIDRYTKRAAETCGYCGAQVKKSRTGKNFPVCEACEVELNNEKEKEN